MTTRRPRAKSVHLTLVLGCLLAWLGLTAAHAGLAPAPADPAEPAVAAQRPAAAAPKGGKGPGTWFLHEHHSGQVAVPGKKGETRELKCETCHAVSEGANDTNRFPGPDLVKYPDVASRAGMGAKLGGLGFVKAHSSCTECHSQLRPGSTWNCRNCHVSTASLMEFPNPQVQLSQFADKFAHKDHSSSKCSECHDDGPKGVSQLLPKHAECFVCHTFKQDGQPPLANDCTGCHANMGPNTPTVDAKLKAPKTPVNAVAAELLTPRTFVLPTAPKPPFNHVGGTDKYHQVLKPDSGPQAGKTLQAKAACIFCHTSATRALARDQMIRFAAKKDAPAANQPPATACVACHVHETQMWVPDGKVPTKAQQAQCKACHTAADAAKAPPASHAPIGGAAAPAKPETKPAATPEKPAATPESKPEPKPTAPPAAKPEAKPTAPPATKPEAKPTAPPATKPEAKPTTPPATKPEAKPATPPAPKPEAKPEPKPEAPPAAKPEAPPAAKPEAPPAAGPVAAHGKYDQWATKNPDGSAPSKTQPTGTLLLGSKDDPVAGAIWGQEKPPAPFNHANHVKPNYAASCEICHHTNTDAKTEGVLKCVACHKEAGNEKNPTSEDGTELDVEHAYHGVEGGKLQAGCKVCHQARSVEPTGCAACHSGKASIETRATDLFVVACHEGLGAPRGESLVESALASVVQLPPFRPLASGRRSPFLIR